MNKSTRKTFEGISIKDIFLVILFMFLASCSEKSHIHDGVYKGPMSTWIINGNDITIIFLNMETKGKIKFEENIAYLGNDNIRQVYQIEYDEDSTKMLVAGSGLSKIEMKRFQTSSRKKS